MKILFLVILIIVLIILLLAFVLSVYNKLVLKKNQLQDYWNKINTSINSRIQSLENNLNFLAIIIDSNTLEQLKNLIGKYKMSVSINDIIQINVEIERIVQKINIIVEDSQENYQEIINLNVFLLENKQQLDREIKEYDDIALSFAANIQAFPTNIVAKLFGFVKWPYIGTDN